MTTAAAASWWADWPKFLPGWFAFAVTVGTLAHKRWIRRHEVALGPADDELREALTAVRTQFEHIIAQPRPPGMFEHETVRRIEDLADRRRDRLPRGELAGVVDAWDSAWSVAPLLRTLGVPSANLSKKDRKQQQEEQARRAEQIEVARPGLEHARAALARLNKLERPTHGRP